MEVYCKLCPKRMPYKHDTTNMMAYLQYNCSEGDSCIYIGLQESLKNILK